MAHATSGNRSRQYEALYDFLLKSGRQTITLSFAEIETILKRDLPPSAYKYSAWWSNSTDRHRQVNAWLCAGYETRAVDISGQSVTFIKEDTGGMKCTAPTTSVKRQNSLTARKIPFRKTDAKTLEVCGYPFTYIQDLLPDCDSSGKVIKYEPQSRYNNKKILPLLEYGSGAFCRFRIESENYSGVYLWICDDEIIYIGETVSFCNRFNTGYGNISPRNCFAGGQSTNCKMNKVVLEYFEQGKRISLYFYPTAEHKRLEKELLNRIATKYNVKDGRQNKSKIRM